MITARAQKQLLAAKTYFREHLGLGDYHSEKQTIAGRWFGKGAARLGLDLSAAVREEEFIRLCDNQHPKTGIRLTPRQNSNRRVFYDFVASACKSVAIMAQVAGDARLGRAHDRVVVEHVLPELEKFAAARVRRGGQRTERITGEIVTAVFRHDTSRALDPLIHSHLVTWNCTYDPVEEEWRALEAGQIYERSRYLTEIYRNALATEIRALGYGLRSTSNGFEIEGVPEELIERFSKRSRTIREAEAIVAAELGHGLTNNGRAAVSHSTRERKLREVGQEELSALHRSQLSPAELASLMRLIPEETPGPSPLIRPELAVVVGAPAEVAETAIQTACEHVFERLSVARETAILEQALRFARAKVTLPALQEALARHPGLLRKNGTVTTEEARQREKQLIALVNAGVGSAPALHRGFVAAATLTREQREVVDFLLRSTDGVMGLKGGAGTGKTFTLTEVIRGIEARDKSVRILAPSTGAVEVWRDDRFPTAETVQRFLVDPGMQERTRGQVVIVDEAGLLSVRQMLSLVGICRDQGCRLILCGDIRQHTSVEAGDALRLLQTRSHLQTAHLNRIRRQVNLEYRRAIAEIAEGRHHRALSRLERMGGVEIGDEESRHRRLAAEYVASIQGGKSALVIAPTWREIAAATLEIRRELQRVGHLRGIEHAIEVHVPKRRTKAENREFREYRPGQILTFHESTRDFARGEWARILSVGPERLVVRKSGGGEVGVTRKQAGCYDVAEVEPLMVTAGERLLLRSSRREARLLSGQLVTVKAVRRNGSIQLTDGRSIPADYRQFTHGYCITSPAAQGKTADHVYVSIDSRSGPAANQKQFYVSASRGREKVRIFTDDLDCLRAALGRNGDRESAVEWTQQAALQPEIAPRKTIRPGSK